MSDDAKSAQARRAAITSQIQAETGIDEAMIERLVREFYVRVRDDAVLGPVFAAKIDDWEPHLQKMFAFWSSVALMSRPLSWPTDGQASAAAYRRAALRSLAGALCRNRAGGLSTIGRGTLYPLVASGWGEP
jgi:Truncated hemoglobins